MTKEADSDNGASAPTEPVASSAANSADLVSKKSKEKDLVIFSNQLIKCGECDMQFTAGVSNTGKWTALTAHYMSRFSQCDTKHMNFFEENSAMMLGNIVCAVCESEFDRPGDVFRHLASESRNMSKMHMCPLVHHFEFEAIILPFVGRDLGLLKSNQAEIVKHLRQILDLEPSAGDNSSDNSCKCLRGDSGTDDDGDDDDFPLRLRDSEELKTGAEVKMKESDTDPAVSESVAANSADVLSEKSKQKKNTIVSNQVIKCGECEMEFTSGISNTENCMALRAHYVSMFGQCDQLHMKFFEENSARMLGPTVCDVCGSEFARIGDLFRHLASKSLNKSKMCWCSLEHPFMFEFITLPFLERDLGFLKSKSAMLKELREILYGSDDSESDESDDDDDGGDDLSPVMPIEICLQDSEELETVGIAVKMKEADTNTVASVSTQPLASSAVVMKEANTDAVAPVSTQPVASSTVVLKDADTVPADSEPVTANSGDVLSKKSKQKKLTIVSNQVIKCGECHMQIMSGISITDNWMALRAHYMSMFAKCDQSHMVFFEENSAMMSGPTACGACGSEFTKVGDLLCHLASESLNMSTLFSLTHHFVFDYTIIPFLGRDLGLLESEPEEIVKHLRQQLFYLEPSAGDSSCDSCKCRRRDDSGSDDDNDDDDGTPPE